MHSLWQRFCKKLLIERSYQTITQSENLWTLWKICVEWTFSQETFSFWSWYQRRSFYLWDLPQNIFLVGNWLHETCGRETQLCLFSFQITKPCSMKCHFFLWCKRYGLRKVIWYFFLNQNWLNKSWILILLDRPLTKNQWLNTKWQLIFLFFFK